MHTLTGNLTEQRLAQDGIQLGDTSALSRIIAVTGFIGLLVSIAFGFAHGWTEFFRSYITNFAFVVSLALGGLFFVLMHHASGAGWSVVLRRIAEAVAATLPWLAILGLPILIPVWLGMKDVYPWANADEVAHDSLLQWKQPYLNPLFFTIRGGIYFGLWGVMAGFYRWQSIAQDNTGRRQHTLRLRRYSGVCILLFALSTTFFAIDLLKSMTPHWYSTIYGVYYFSGAIVGFFALLAVFMWLLQVAGKLEHSITIEHYHDVGKYVFSFVVFWTYISFSQYMLIWYANLPEETAWYAARQQSAWWIGVSLLLLIGHFVVPFWAILSRRTKRSKFALAVVSLWVLLMHWVDMYYLVGPQSHHFYAAGHASDTIAESHAVSPINVTDVTLLLALGSVFLLLVLELLRSSALIPKRDPQLEESLAFENY